MDLNWKPPRQRQVAAAPAGLTHLGMPRWGPSLRRFLCLNNSSWTLFWYRDNPTTSSTMELVAESTHFGIAWLIDCQFRFSPRRCQLLPSRNGLLSLLDPLRLGNLWGRWLIFWGSLKQSQIDLA
jgi:hypothetical protein